MGTSMRENELTPRERRAEVVAMLAEAARRWLAGPGAVIGGGDKESGSRLDAAEHAGLDRSRRKRDADGGQA